MSYALVQTQSMRAFGRDPLEDARLRGLSVSIAELGDWFPATLAAEYDRAARAIRVSGAALRKVCGALGDCEGPHFVRAAVAHELYHHDVAEGRILAPRNRKALEREAHEFVRGRYGLEPVRFERVLR